MLNERQAFILDMLKDVGSVQVDALAASFDVSTQTIRRDLSELCDRGLAARIHGGAKRAISTSTIGYEDRRSLEITAKNQIAELAAQLIDNNSSIAVNIGTTTEQVATAIKYHKGLTVITNNINVVHTLRDARMKSLIIVGGEVRISDGAIVGSGAVESFQKYKVDYAIIGASSLDKDGSVLDFDPREVAVARAILANARTSILVCDKSKFNVSAPHRICQIDELDFVVTDAPPPLEFEEVAKRGNTKIIVTGKENEVGEHKGL